MSGNWGWEGAEVGKNIFLARYRRYEGQGKKGELLKRNIFHPQGNAPLFPGGYTSLHKTGLRTIAWLLWLDINSISIYTLSDLGVLSNLIGSLSLANEHYSPPTE